MKKIVFDREAFYQAVDRHRRKCSLTWRRVSEETGIASSTFTRMKNGGGIDVDGLAILLQWASLNAEDFAIGQEGK